MYYKYANDIVWWHRRHTANFVDTGKCYIKEMKTDLGPERMSWNRANKEDGIRLHDRKQ